MATNIVRATQLVGALIDATPTAQQLNTVADALIAMHRGDVIAAGLDPDNLTNEQRAAVTVRAVKDWIRTQIKEQAIIADSQVQTLRQGVFAQINTVRDASGTDFPSEW